jgi:sugar phosphate isomerase/epimerase
MTKIRFGAPLSAKTSSPEDWILALKAKGYDAAYAPLSVGASDDLVAEYRQAAQENNIVIAEVGAWLNNPLSPDKQEVARSIEATAQALAFADRLGANCCVNVSGSRGPVWDGPDGRNLTEETFYQVAESVKEIIRLATPQRACYALEMMPWMYPTGAEDQIRLLQYVNHPRFGVHFDPCNTVNSVEKYFANDLMIADFFGKLHDKICSVHCKDVRLQGNMTVHLSECCPGEGNLRHDVLLSMVAQYNPDIPVMMEHLSRSEQYDQAIEHMRKVADSLHLTYCLPQG